MPWLLLFFLAGTTILLKRYGVRAGYWYWPISIQLAAWLGMGVCVLMVVAAVASAAVQDVAHLSETEIAACRWSSVAGIMLGTAALRRLRVL